MTTVSQKVNRVTVSQASNTAAVQQPRTSPVIVEEGRTLVVRGQGTRGPVGPSGDRVEAIVELSEAVSAAQVVAIGPDETAHLADAADLDDADMVLGLAATSGLIGESITVVLNGRLEAAGPYQVGPLFVGHDGDLVSTPIEGGFLLQVATALSSTDLLVRVDSPILRSA